MDSAFMTIGQVAQEVGVSRWRLAYLIERGEIPPPSAEVPGRRLFSPEDVQKIKVVLQAKCERTGGRRSPQEEGSANG